MTSDTSSLLQKKRCKCEMCKKPAELRPFRYKGVVEGKYCKTCRTKRSEEIRKEMNNKRARDRYHSGFTKTKKLALERDQYKCVVCGQEGTNVHHIREFADSKDSSLDNLVTLCEIHHAAAHGKYKPFEKIELCRLYGYNPDEIDRHIHARLRADQTYNRCAYEEPAVKNMRIAMMEYIIAIYDKFGISLTIKTHNHVTAYREKITFYRIEEDVDPSTFGSRNSTHANTT